MSRPLRVAVIGCGGIAQMMHLPTLAERPDLFSIVGLADLDAATLQAVADRYHVGVRTTHVGELVVHPDVEAVLVVASGSHREPVLASLEAGKHVFVEKPLGFSLAETETVARAARESRVRVMVGYHKRFDPAYKRAVEEVRRIEGLRFVDVTTLHPDDGAYRSHHPVLPLRERAVTTEAAIDRGARDWASTGEMGRLVDESVGDEAPPAVRVAVSMLFQSLIHDINAVRGILGEPEEVLSAHAWRGGMAQTSLTRFAGDVRVVMNWISVPGVKHYEERLKFVGPDRRVTLTFPSPYLRNAPTPLTIERAEGDELVVEERTVSYEEAFCAELHHFREAVLAGRAPSPGVDDAVGDARWIDAIARALLAGERPTRSGS